MFRQMYRQIGLLLVLFCSLTSQAQITVLTHVQLIDGTGSPAEENVSLVISGDRISSILHGGHVRLNRKAHIVDLRGMTIIPGLINAHGHLALVAGAKNSPEAYTRENVLSELRQYERYGVTSMLSLGLNRDLLYSIRQEQHEGKLDGATVFTADRGIGVPDGAPPLPHQPDQLYQPATAEAARAVVREIAERHPDFLKIWVDDLYGTHPKMSPEVIRAVIDEAHQHHIPVAAHVYALSDAKFLVAAGIDVLAHSIRDTLVDEELIQAMKHRGVFYLPTLTVDESAFVFADHPDYLRDPFLTQAIAPEALAMFSSEPYRAKVSSDPATAHHRQDFAIAQKNLLLLSNAGIKVGFGTDSGAMPARVPGYAEHRELELMVAAGLTPLQAIHDATAVNAALLGVEAKQGSVTAGKMADFIVLRANPLDDIRNTRAIVAVYHHGKSTPGVAQK